MGIFRGLSLKYGKEDFFNSLFKMQFDKFTV